MSDAETIVAVSLVRRGAVAEVTIDRPAKMNALDAAVFAGLPRAAAAIAADASVRAVVLTGAGANFSAGIDIDHLKAAVASGADFGARLMARPEGTAANEFQAPARCWQELDRPVIAALRGVCFGGGAQIALGADLRFAAPDLRMSIMEIKWGLIPDMGLMASLPRLMRMDRAKDLVLTGRIVGAEEALALGLVTRIEADPLAAAREAAEAMAARSPDAIRRAKRLLEAAWTADPADALRLEAVLQGEVIGRPNQVEAVRANMEKRPPRFAD